MEYTKPIVVKTQMLIRRPVADVFQAFIDPAITSRFWFSRGSEPLVQGRKVTWHWDMYGFSVEVLVRELETNQRILIAWPTPVEWRFHAKAADKTFVEISADGFTGDSDQQITSALDSMGGFSFVLAACKAWLEHGIALNLVADHSPDA